MPLSPRRRSPIREVVAPTAGLADTGRAMSRENVEVVRRMLDAFLSADFEAALSLYAPDVEWDGTNLPDGQIGRGHEAIMEHLTRWAAQ